MTSSSPAPIAVIGLAYRAPGVGRKGLLTFLSEAKSAFSEIPRDRFHHESYFYNDANKAGVLSAKGAYFLKDDLYAFDAPFFNMNAEEATSMDPQQRLLLECALEAAENAGLPLDKLAGSKTGVFSALERSEYSEQMTDDLPTTTKYTVTGIAGCMASNRLSYFFDLTGPSISMDSACSSSGYAVHMACQSLRRGECNTAFVGASSLIVNQNVLIQLDTMGALSPDGKCYSYESKANGFGRGEGASCLILKRLDDAVEAGDAIHAIIRNTATNHSGRTRGITMPSQRAQEELLTQLHAEIGVRPADTDVVEGHGTGTQVGDPIDAGAVAEVIAKEREEKVYIGSLKSNFGHLLSASGLFSVIKAILMLRHATILPNAEFNEMNPKIDASKLIVAQKPVPWVSMKPRRVCVTNFGFGGSNAAILLEEFIERNAISKDLDDSICQQRLYPFSAKSGASLSKYLTSLESYLRESPGGDSFMSDLSFTLGTRRTHFSHRVGLVASSSENLREQLASISPSSIEKAGAGHEPVSAFVFTGQGAQHARMAMDLSKYEFFTKAMTDAESYLQEFGAKWSLTEELSKSETDGSRINGAEISQPACTAIQIALVKLLRSWGITPAAVTGHSSGEIAAAYTVGLISFKTAMAVAFFRGQATINLQEQGESIQGGMIALGTDIDTATALLEHTASHGRASIAAINSPNSVTLSGDVSAINAVERIANAQGLFNRRLKVGVAYHSHHMEFVAGSYLSAIKPYFTAEPSSQNSDQAAFFSSVTGHLESAHVVACPEYWVKNLVSQVRFSEAISTLLSTPETPINILMEIGPHAALKGPINQILQSMNKSPSPIYIPSLVRGTEDDKSVLTLASRYFALGGRLDFSAVNKPTNGRQGHVMSDLPAYEWNKKSRYVHTSWITGAKLFPKHTYTPLLGWKQPSGGRDEHVFRQVFTLDEMPWLRDHKVVGDVLFPFAGFMSLAVDAFRCIINTDNIQSVLIREFHVQRGLPIREEQRVDISTKLRPAEAGTGHFSSSIWSLEISTWSEVNGWVTHAHGRIEAGTGTGDMGVGVASPTWRDAEELLLEANPTCEDAQSGYDVLEKSGFHFGPTFKNMVELWTAPGKAVQRTRLREIDQLLSVPERGSHITVDPPMIDALLHSVILVSGDTYPDPRPAFVPTYVARLHISNTIPTVPGQMFTTVAVRRSLETKPGRAEVTYVVYADGPEERIPCLEVDITFTCINDTTGDTDHRIQTLPEGYYETFIPHVNFSDGGNLAASFSDRTFDAKELELRQKQTAVGQYFLARALASVQDRDSMPLHLDRFLTWAEEQVTDYIPASPELLNEVAQGSATGALICAVGENLPKILRGEIEPLEVMMKDGLLMRHYEDDQATRRGNQALAKYIAGLGELNPDLRILEIGGGTGSATLPILEALSGEDEASAPNFQSYTFTDISSGFFNDARKKLSKWPQVTYTKLDISLNPTDQGFEIGAYDLVIANNVLHATPDIEETIRNVGRLLKSGTGKLALLETTHGVDAAFLPYTILPGWWLASDSWRRSEEGPLLTPDVWDRVLVSSGFSESGVEGAVDDWPGAAEHRVTAMWSTRAADQDADDEWLLEEEEVEDTPRCLVTIIITPEHETKLIAQALSSDLEELPGTTISPRVCPLSELPESESRDTFVVFLDFGEVSYLTNLASREDFDFLKVLLLDTRGLLWVTPDAESPEFSRIKGLLRTLRLEDSTKKLWHLDNVPRDINKASDIITQLASQLVADTSPTALLEQEFTWSEGLIKVPRLRKLRKTRETFAIESGLSVREEQNIWEGSGPDNALRMSIDTQGDMDSIFFERHSVLSSANPLRPDEIIIEVDSVGVNFRDVLLLLGTIPWSLPGIEGAGTVVQTGADVTHVKSGDRVFYMVERGGFSTFVRIPADHAIRIPSGISPAEAASVPIAYSTALVSLDHIARLRPGETVLIHSGTGATGQACIRLTQAMGGIVFATAGSEEKRAFLHETFGIPKDHIYSSRTRDFASGIRNKTNGRGVDVVVNSLSGQLLQETWSLVAEFGRFIEIGKKDILANSHLSMRQFYRNVSFSCIDLMQYFTRRPECLKDCLARIAQLLEEKVIQPIQPIQQVPVSRLVSGLRALQSGQNIGKVVAVMGKGEKVMAEKLSPLYRKADVLRNDATYLITGGTGGIGRSLVPWALQNGAANVIMLGRSGASNPDVADLINQYNNPSSGISVRAIKCDVALRADLIAALDSLQDLPPVKGVIHSSLYLRDSIFFNATFEDWRAINGPKIDAAWHLHELLPDLDFLVALASATNVVGNIGQSIYTGTSAFLDAFAAWRSIRGQPTVSISLPIVDDVGYVVQQEGLREKLDASLGIYLPIAHVQDIIKGAIIGASSGLNQDARTIAFIRNDSQLSFDWEKKSHYVLSLRQKRLENHEASVQTLTGEDSVLDALISKVSSITMIDREDVTATRSLSEYGLDSLVSVELRNWMKREYGVDLALTQIVAAANLQTLTDQILTRRK
ncbi:putative polyketide synthase [Xylaria sp. CBS 124048]|nr:putative polyketide synthase [Xylaria sp. CBS 124048]